MHWVAFYIAQAVAVLTFGALTAWGLNKDWEGVYIVFGIALLITGCDMVKPA